MALAINTELLRLYWRMGADICEKQKQYKWGAKVVEFAFACLGIIYIK